MTQDKWIKRVCADGLKLAALIVTAIYVVAVLTAVVTGFLPGIFVRSQFLVKRSDTKVGDGQRWISMTRTENGADFAFRFYTDERTAHMTIDQDERFHFEFGDGTTIAGRRMDTWTNSDFVLEEGNPPKGYVSYGKDAARSEYSPDKEVLAGALYRMYTGEFATRGSRLKQWLLSVAFYGCALIMWLWPKETMLFGRRWQYKKAPEFSDDALHIGRVGAAVLALCAFAILFIPA